MLSDTALGLSPAARQRIRVGYQMIDATDAQAQPLKNELQRFGARQPACRALVALPVPPETLLWSWGESNPRPPSGRRPRYDHSRDLRLYGCRTAGSVGPARGPPPGLSLGSAVFSRRQRSFPPSTTASVARLR
jgi:hypothetical protein